MADVGSPGRATDEAVRMARSVALPVVRLLFRPSFTGLEHLPEQGPYMVVSNHNAGLGVAELISFIALWAERFENKRPIAGFAHPLGFKYWPMTLIHRHIGSIPSTYEAAYAALGAGVPIIVFPGGDYETLRPVWHAKRVDFGGRKGFLRIARTAGVPIVPMGITGSHYTAPMLLRSRALAWILIVPRLFGQKRWGISLLCAIGLLGIAFLPLELWMKLVIAWFWSWSLITLVPWVPATIRFRIGAPLSTERVARGELEDAYDLVIGAVQELVR
jgi:1-acyl-sn-glycerol-3-phosphate acyltransferase